MSASTTVSLLLFPGLALVALSIGLLARRYSAPALVVGLTGLVTLATASTWIIATRPTTEAPPLDKPVIDTALPKVVVPAPEPKGDDARPRGPSPPASPPEAQRPNANVERLEKELQAEREKRAAAETTSADADRRAADAATRAAELVDKLSKTQKGIDEAERKASILEDRLRGAVPAPPPPRPLDLASIRRKLVDGDQRYFTAHEERELISGKSGSWYVIRLLDGGKDWGFADRQFVLADATEIKKSTVRLRDDVLAPLTQAGQNWRLFVRGSADVRPVAGPVRRDLSYLPRLPDETYAQQPTSKQVSLPVRNEDLPTLRADWLREIVRPVLGSVAMADIELFENPPRPGHGRTAELVLFVEW